MDDPSAVPAAVRSLHLAFTDAGAFLREYARNLAKGGAFVPSDESFEPRELVEVRVEVPFAAAKLTLAAEVVHGGPGGVAVQFLEPAPELRARFETAVERAEALQAEAAATATSAPPAAADPLGLGDPPAGDDLESLGLGDERAAASVDPSTAVAGFEATALGDEPDPNDRTFRDRANRAPTRVPVRVKGPTGKALQGRTRDLSRSGVLLSIDGEELPVGRDVELELAHPGTGETLAIAGRVVRHLSGEGVVPAVAVQIRTGADRAAVERFVDEVQRIDEEQQRAGIRGALEELGAVGLLQMVAALARRGTLTVNAGVEEGVVCFADGELVSAQVGSVKGVKALARIFGWSEGFFEFRAHVDEEPRAEDALPMEGAILDALRVLDEAKRHAGPEIAPGARFAVHREHLEGLADGLETTEEAVLDLAAAGFTVRRILDVIPETDVAIRAAILTLLERGLLSLR